MKMFSRFASRITIILLVISGAPSAIAEHATANWILVQCNTNSDRATACTYLNEISLQKLGGIHRVTLKMVSQNENIITSNYYDCGRRTVQVQRMIVQDSRGVVTFDRSNIFPVMQIINLGPDSVVLGLICAR